MNSNSDEINVFNKVKKFLEWWNYCSPSYAYYMLIEKNIDRDIKFKEIKKKISEAMKYFFYFIDFVFISLILLKNTINILSSEVTFNKILYTTITCIAIYIGSYCVYEINKNVRNKENDNDQKDLVEKIIELNDYRIRITDQQYKKFINVLKRGTINFSLRRTIYLGAIMFIIGLGALLNKYIRIGAAAISILYFITRPIHYYIVFYKDFKNKIKMRVVNTPDDKIRYINLVLSNYIKIILEFCILIYICKYMGWAFVNIKITTFFELVYLVVLGDLEAITGIEIFINLLRIATLGMVITLNLATYMSLEVRNEEIEC